MQPTLEQWLARKPRQKSPPRPLKRSRVRKVSSRRAKQLREYAAKRKAFLLKNPYCQIWLKRMGMTESHAVLWGGQYMKDMTVYWAPRSVEVHHVRGRIGAMLNDERYWLAASREEHEWAHSHPKEARALGIIV